MKNKSDSLSVTDVLALERTLLAEKRTILAEISASVGLGALGFVLIKLFYEPPLGFLLYLGVIFVVVSIVFVILSIKIFVKQIKIIEEFKRTKSKHIHLFYKR